MPASQRDYMTFVAIENRTGRTKKAKFWLTLAILATFLAGLIFGAMLIFVFVCLPCAKSLPIDQYRAYWNILDLLTLFTFVAG
jgi:hypothetical protein